jgi:hypothetical protein
VVTRRAFLGTLAGGLLAAPLAAAAQQPQVASRNILRLAQNSATEVLYARIQHALAA